ncbi:hypothetical protein [Natronoflexus pectinivorans]|uniref:Uncharacterized protein n=1 Tax=Natronoflexus pectinivorans TaxID=682526 RepID=A0A4R2G491_9BACT|nr:hypothetical protein [Natronoflexus pectinivorans]TCO02181.1 hypothetical protein EV194_1282 [Natronoflexus pectinivorans]
MTNTSISKPLLNFLIICFWASIVLFVLQIIVSFRTFFLFHLGIETEPHFLIQAILFMLSTLWIFLFFYTLYFFFKNDRYSKSGIFFFFFHLIYALIYFYRVIWQQKRELVGSYKSEPVLDKSIFIESAENEEINEVEQKEYWRQLWLQSIFELSSIEYQRIKWLDSKNDNPHCSFGEFMNSYFNDTLSDFEYSHYINIYWVSRQEYEIIKEWHAELDKYEAPDNDDYNDEAILNDKKWIRIVKKGEQARNKLFEILKKTEQKYLMDENNKTDYI